MNPNIRLIWNRDWVNALVELPAPGTFMGDVLAAAYESAANRNRGPLPADELEAFKAQVRELYA